MATSSLTSTTVEFTSNGIDINAQWTASNETFTLFSTSGPFNSVQLTNCNRYELIGTTSGNIFGQEAHVNTATYSVIWPAAQATGAGEVLTNDGAGNLTWTTPPNTPSSGAIGDIQLSDGAGGFTSAVLSQFNFTDGDPISSLNVGVASGTFELNGINSGTQGSSIDIQSGVTTGGTNPGGNLGLYAGDQTSGVGGGNGGSVSIESGESVLQDSGSVSIITGNGNGNSGGIFFTVGTGGTNGGPIELNAGDGTSGNGGSISFSVGQGGTNDGIYEFYEVGTTTALMTVLGSPQNATTTSSGTLQVISGVGITGTVYANELTSDTLLNLNGSVSGNVFSQQANDTTTTYTIIWPDAQATGAGEVLTNDGAGNLTWTTPASVSSAGNSGDIQLSDGSGNFIAATLSLFNYTDGDPSSSLDVGVEDGSFSMNSADGVTLAGCNFNISSGDGGNGVGVNGGNLNLQSGAQTLGTGDGGSMTLETGDGSTNGGNFNVITGQGGSGDGGNIEFQVGIGGTSNGVIEFRPGDATAEEFCFWQNSTGLTNLLSVYSISENATDTSTGTLRILSGGLGVNQDIYASNINATTTLGLEGSISGNLFSQEADASTAVYSVVWPAAQATGAGEVLTNDGAGNLSWAIPSGVAAGTTGDIQYNDGSGGFAAATISEFTFTDGATCFIRMGSLNDDASIIGVSDTAGAGNGCGIVINAGQGFQNTDGGNAELLGGDVSGGTGTGNGGQVVIRGGLSNDGSGGDVTISGGGCVSGVRSGDISIVCADVGSAGTDGGSITLSAADASGAGATGGSLIFTLGSTSTIAGDMIFNGAYTGGADANFYFRDSAANNSIVILSGNENATSSTTGTLRVVNGIGATGNIYGGNLRTDGSLGLEGSVSGNVFAQSAEASTSAYSVIWPAAQATGAGEVLTNDGAGNLSWSIPSGVAAGTTGDIQYNDGSDGFAAASLSVFRFTDSATVPEMLVGVDAASATFTMEAVSRTLAGGTACGITILGAEHLNNGVGGPVSIIGGNGFQGGNVFIRSGDETSGISAQGNITIQSPNSTTATSTGTINLLTGNTTVGGSGNVVLDTGDGVGLSGLISFRTGTASGGDTGDITFNTGNSSSDASGLFRVTTGTGSTNGGNIVLISGNGGTNGGNINLTAGDGTSTNGGSFSFTAGDGGVDGGNIDFTVGTAGSGTNGQYRFNNTAGGVLVTILNTTEASTSTTTGTMRIDGGLGVDGDIYCDTVNATSDVRMKENIRYLSSRSCLSQVLQMRGVEYSLRGRQDDRRCGLLANELLDSLGLTSIVKTTGRRSKSNSNSNSNSNSEFLSIDYHGIIAVLIESIKELSMKVDYLVANSNSNLSLK